MFQDKGTFYPSSNLRSAPSPPKNFSSSFSRKCAETLLTYNYLVTLMMMGAMMVIKKNKKCLCVTIDPHFFLYPLSIRLSPFIFTFSNIPCGSSIMFFGLQLGTKMITSSRVSVGTPRKNIPSRLSIRGAKRDVENTPKCTHLNCIRPSGDDDDDRLILFQVC